MKLIIVRHAEPNYEIDSLTEKGFKEAELLSNRLSKMKIDYAYCSPLGRAKDTAKPTLEKLNINAIELDWLREFEGKIRNGLKLSQCWDRKPEDWCVEDKYYDYYDWFNTKIMKSYNVSKENQRVKEGIDELLKQHGYVKNGRYYDVVNSNHDTIVLFCHFAVECVIMSHIFSCSPMVLWHNFVALPSSVTCLITEEREEGKAAFRCNYFGDLSHLYCANEEPSFAARFCECFDDDTRH